MDAFLLNGDDDDDDDDALTESEDEAVVEVPKKAGVKALLKGAPRDLFAVIAVVFLESLSYFCMTNTFILMLEGEYGMDDVQSTSIYAIFGIAISVYAIFFGWIVDVLLVRKSLLLHVGLGLVSKVLLGFMPSRPMLWIVLLGPLSFTLSIGGTTVLAAIRRYTTIHMLTVAFSLRYISMNIGSLVSEPLADAVRVGFVPALKASGLQGYSVFLGLTALLHAVNLALVWFFVRDVCVVEETDRHVLGAELVDSHHGVVGGSHVRAVSTKWQTERIVRRSTMGARRPFKERARDCRDAGVPGAIAWLRGRAIQFRSKLSWNLLGFVILSFGTMGAKSVFRYLDSLYPLWMSRAAYPVADPAQVPFNTFIMVNPIIVILFTTALASFMERRHWHPYWVILGGTLIAGLAPFWMMIVQYWAVLFFITQLSLGEITWSPMMSTYSCWFAPEGEEGIFFALATIPLFGAKAVAGYLSGQVLSTYCPPHQPVNLTMVGLNTTAVMETLPPPPGCSPIVWFIVGCLAMSSPVIILVFMKCIKINDPNKKIADDDALYLDAGTLTFSDVELDEALISEI